MEGAEREGGRDLGEERKGREETKGYVLAHAHALLQRAAVVGENDNIFVFLSHADYGSGKGS